MSFTFYEGCSNGDTRGAKAVFQAFHDLSLPTLWKHAPKRRNRNFRMGFTAISPSHSSPTMWKNNNNRSITCKFYFTIELN